MTNKQKNSNLDSKNLSVPKKKRFPGSSKFGLTKIYGPTSLVRKASEKIEKDPLLDHVPNRR